ncbi:sugar transferase [Alsobacter sp. SYSU M60028]|uniref:Sugar transferase n=1 Tax=Alsobacter ponti TaxID=2962936 RepID=A0ABT1LBF0_9HYPH|nr:sugar transferase [Alsobacter ponti]MCP8938426.1 sugar transferase [Alsobacter ponti]
MSVVRPIAPARSLRTHGTHVRPSLNWRAGVLAGLSLTAPWALAVLHRVSQGQDLLLPPDVLKATTLSMGVALASTLTRGSSLARTWQVVGLAAAATAALAVLEPASARIDWYAMALTAFLAGFLMLTAQRLARPVRIGAIPSSTQIGPTDPAIDMLMDASLAQGPYDVLLINPEVSQNPSWSRYVITSACAGTRLDSIVDHIEQATGRVMPDRHRPDELVQSVRQARLYAAVKRGCDLALVLLMAPSALILSGIAMLAILVTMGRPIIFAQDRVGKDGRVFRMFKLRTMRPRKEGEAQCATAVNDSRITPLGKALRRTHVDELPQLWNVLIGDMSMIGPRPEQPGLVEKYEGLIPNYAMRHAVRPGITGWSQVRFGYAETVEETAQKLEYDLFYIREFGPAMDLSIAWRTVMVMFNPAHVR